MTSEEEKVQKIWDRVLEEALEKTEGKRPNEMTLEEIMLETGMKRRTAGYFMQAKIDAGEFKVRLVRGRNYYSPISEP